MFTIRILGTASTIRFFSAIAMSTCNCLCRVTFPPFTCTHIVTFLRCSTFGWTLLSCSIRYASRTSGCYCWSAKAIRWRSKSWSSRRPAVRWRWIWRVALIWSCRWISTATRWCCSRRRILSFAIALFERHGCRFWWSTPLICAGMVRLFENMLYEFIVVEKASKVKDLLFNIYCRGRKVSWAVHFMEDFENLKEIDFLKKAF